MVFHASPSFLSALSNRIKPLQERLRHRYWNLRYDRFFLSGSLFPASLAHATILDVLVAIPFYRKEQILKFHRAQVFFPLIGYQPYSPFAAVPVRRLYSETDQT